jgi:hypothetical protein
MLEQELEPGVRVGGAAEAGELAHRPQLSAVARGMDAARERERAGERHVRRPRAEHVERGVQRVDFAFAVRECDVTFLTALVALPPRSHLGAKLLELSRLTTNRLVAIVARGARKISHRRHGRVRVRR